MDNNNNGDDDETGYKKPPKAHQFVKGKSGNPKGRPRVRKVSFLKTTEQLLQERVVIKKNGKIQYMTKAEIINRQIIDAAAKGDLRAARILFYDMERVAKHRNRENEEFQEKIDNMTPEELDAYEAELDERIDNSRVKLKMSEDRSYLKHPDWPPKAWRSDLDDENYPDTPEEIEHVRKIKESNARFFEAFPQLKDNFPDLFDNDDDED